MLAALLLLALAAADGVTSPAIAPATRPSIADELERYYGFDYDKSKGMAHWDREHLQQELDQYNEKPSGMSSWDASMKQLAAGRPDERRAATDQLLTVLDQCWNDEQSGKARWRATPYWGSSGENPARQLRQAIMEAVDHAPPTPELVPLIDWTLNNEVQLPLQATAVKVLGKIDGKEADAERRALVHRPHPNAFVLAGVLDQLAVRREPLPADELHALCHHHRDVVRRSARSLNAALHGTDPGPFDPMAAMRSPPVRRTLDQLQALLIDLPNKDATFVELTVRYMLRKEIKGTDTAQGWLIKRDAKTAIIYTPQGRLETYTDQESTQIKQDEKTEDGRVRSTAIDVITSVSVLPYPIENYAKRIAAIRARGNQDFELSSQGGLTGQFEGPGASLPEIIVAAWLDRAGKNRLCADILLPALDTLYRDQDIVGIARQRLGILAGYRMLVAFAGDRNYEQALKNAREIVTHYPDSQFYKYATDFGEQLPRRMDDFKTLTLPTPAAWAVMKSQMSRKTQIDFLCKRLRLLNCFQHGQPGGYFDSDPQYAEPCGLSDNAAWGLSKGKTVVINPLVELAGERSGFFADGHQPSKGLELAVVDIEYLAPWLRENWYELIVSFWRDFAVSRDLIATRSKIANVIDGIAHRDLCNANAFDTMSAAQQEEQIRKIIEWAQANKGKTDEQLIVESLQADINNNANWNEVQGGIEQLVGKKSQKAADFIEHYLAQDERQNTSAMLSDLTALDRRKATAWARKFLRDDDAYVRAQSAILVLQSGDVHAAIPVLAATLPVGSGNSFGGLAAEAVDELLKVGSPEATKAATTVLLNPAFRRPNAFSEFHSPVRPRIVRRLESAGHPEGYQVYLELLDFQGNTYGETTYGDPPAQIAVNEILDAWKADPKLQRAAKIKDLESRRLAVKSWVREKASRTGGH